MIRTDRGLWILIPLLLLPGAASGDSVGRELAAPQLYAWSADLDLLATEGEKQLFSGLQEDAEREMFFQQFWQARDPFPQTNRNELREVWESRLAEAHRRWHGLNDDRSRIFLLRGEPSSAFAAHCPQSGSFEVWTYEPGFRVDRRIVLVFATGSGPARLWQPGSPPDLTAAAAELCADRGRLKQEARWIRALGYDTYQALLAQILAPPLARDWVTTFRPAALGAPDTPRDLRDPLDTRDPRDPRDPRLAEAVAALAEHRPRLRLLRPLGRLLIGQVGVPVWIEQAPDAPPGERIERVAFFLDGKPLLTRNHPPFDLLLDLGPVPRPRQLEAAGMNGQGEVVARDEMRINAGAGELRVRLLEPRSGGRYRQSLGILAEVTPPPGTAVERVEIWFGEERIATLYQPPYSLPFVLPREEEAGYVRAIAYLAAEGSAEDTVFINTPAEPDAIDVRTVELYATVLDGQGRPVTGGRLEPAAFSVLEDGVRQEIREAAPVGDTPVRMAILIDSSASMEEEMKATRQAALGFLRSVLRPQDQAEVIAFNRSPQVMVPLTGDLGRLERGIRKIVAEKVTTLYDSLVYSLLDLAGVKGQRAVLLLTDGEDRGSRLDFAQTLEAARRMGIAVYVIGLGLPGGPQGDAGARLTRLSTATGGKSFFIAGVENLAGVYAQIATELRAQYKIAYQSSNTGTDDAFRAVQVRMAAAGLEARTISGYYP